MKIILLLASLVFLTPIASALPVDVSTNLPSGTYSAPIRLQLTATQPQTKTFFSFKPDGYPDDAFLYTGSILIKQSTPFVFFSIVSETNESKIKQNSYVFNYGSSLRFSDRIIPYVSTGSLKISLVNESSIPMNIGFWLVLSETDSFEIPEGTKIGSGEKYELNLGYAGTSSVVLQSPDGEEHDILQIVAQDGIKSVVVPHTVKKPMVATPTKKIVKVDPVSTGRVFVSTEETGPSIPETSKTVDREVLVTQPIPSESSINQINPEVISNNKNTSNSFANAVKVSVSESKNSQISPIYIFGITVFFLCLGVAQFLMRRKRQKV